MKRHRVWLALFATPLILAAVFTVVAVYLSSTRGLQGDDVRAAIEPIALYPVSLGFLAALLVTRTLARRDGLSLVDLGWTRPRVVDIGIGAVVGAALCALNALVLHPLIIRATPGFDPTLQAYALPTAVVALTIAVAAEDTLYRGYALRVLGDRHGKVVAVVVTTVFYALLTPQGLPLTAWAVGFGLVLCGLRLWRGTLWAGAIAHWIVALGPKLASMAGVVA